LNWRDRLPNDIAIQKRLDYQGGLRSIHKFRGYRLSMPQQCYRVYNDLCEKGTPLTAFEFYSRQWRMRRSHYRLENVPNAYRPEYDGDNLTDIIERNSFPEKSEDLDVIPEKFLWHAFLDLVDACIFLRDGTGQEPEGNGSWRPIIHKDMHLGNIFLKLSPECEPAQVKVSQRRLSGFFQNFYTSPARRDATKAHQILEFSAEKPVCMIGKPTTNLRVLTVSVANCNGGGLRYRVF
jgi:hypothetical protein